MHYILKIRVARHYYPVTWPEGSVCWSSEDRPTVFNSKGRRDVEAELIETGAFLPGDYVFEEIEAELSNPLTPSEGSLDPADKVVNIRAKGGFNYDT